VQPGFCVKVRNRANFVITIATLVLIGEVCFASSDVEYWETAEVSIGINKNWGCTFEEQIRVRVIGTSLKFYF